MKSILLALLLFFSLTTVFGQTTKDYYIKWSPNAVTDSVQYYEVYIQIQPINTGWAIVDGAEYTTALQPYFKANVTSIPGKTTDYSYTVNLSLAGGWAIAGIIANNEVRSVLSASTAKKLLKKPGKPSNVRIEETP